MSQRGILTPRWVDVFFSLRKSNIFSQKAKKKHVKHDRLLCSYLVLRFFSVRLSSSFLKKNKKNKTQKTTSISLFKWIGGARFRFFSLRKKRKGTDIETITSCCNFLSNFRTQTQLQICAELYIYTHTHTRVLFYSGPKFFNVR